MQNVRDVSIDHLSDQGQLLFTSIAAVGHSALVPEVCHRANRQVAYEAALALQDVNANILQPAQDSRHSGTKWYKLVAQVKFWFEVVPQLAAQSAAATHIAAAQNE